MKPIDLYVMVSRLLVNVYNVWPAWTANIESGATPKQIKFRVYKTTDSYKVWEEGMGVGWFISAYSSLFK